LNSIDRLVSDSVSLTYGPDIWPSFLTLS